MTVNAQTEFLRPKAAVHITMAVHQFVPKDCAFECQRNGNVRLARIEGRSIEGDIRIQKLYNYAVNGTKCQAFAVAAVHRSTSDIETQIADGAESTRTDRGEADRESLGQRKSVSLKLEITKRDVQALERGTGDRNIIDARRESESADKKQK